VTAERPVVLMAAGGTGGHVFPGLAIASDLASMGIDPVFVGTARGLESKLVGAAGYPLELLDARPMQGAGITRRVVGAATALRESVRAMGIVRRRSPRVCVSIGGYAAGPIALACLARRIPVVVCEPNEVTGLAHRILAPFVQLAFVASERAGATFRPTVRRIVGVPLRQGFEPRPYVAHDPPRVLILGGSQGAEALDERVPDALSLLATRSGQALDIHHQSGGNRVEAVRERYRSGGITDATVVPFFDDVAAELAQADFVVSRAGAGSIAELTAVGRPALLVPYPFAADDHQTKNAERLAASGAAIHLPQDEASPGRLAEALALHLRDVPLRAKMAALAAKEGRPQARAEIAREVAAIARKGS
jgi:UDP-N-acetylglucosamine--N-acetylmuramyl-(pentapeptide) pyrophosphoryl-undecaprenol N-acetylglucosamine transferase